MLESLCVVAASLSRAWDAGGSAFGIAAAGFTGTVRPFGYLAPSEAAGQLGRVLDVLARLSSVPSASFETLLSTIARLVRPGMHDRRAERPPAGTHAVGAPSPLILGFPILFVAFGPDADRNAAVARSAGIAARVATLDGPWRTATELAIAG